MKQLFFILFICSTGILKSQVTQQEISTTTKKYHYILHKVNDIDSLKLYNTALSKINLDEYRLINKRRTILFDTGVKVELLSAKELQNKCGKLVSPLNKKKSAPIIFYIKPDAAEIIVKQK